VQRGPDGACASSGRLRHDQAHPRGGGWGRVWPAWPCSRTGSGHGSGPPPLKNNQRKSKRQGRAAGRPPPEQCAQGIGFDSSLRVRARTAGETDVEISPADARLDIFASVLARGEGGYHGRAKRLVRLEPGRCRRCLQSSVGRLLPSSAARGLCSKLAVDAADPAVRAIISAADAAAVRSEASEARCYEYVAANREPIRTSHRTMNSKVKRGSAMFFVCMDAHK
jgi:hypothetical protein